MRIVYVDRPDHRSDTGHRRVVITKHGRPAVVVLAVDNLEALEETLDVMSDPQAMADLREAADARRTGKAIELTREPSAHAGRVDEYGLRWSPPAVRRLDRLAASSPRIASPVVEFCFGRLIAKPHRIGRPLGRELEGWYSARVGP